MSSFDHFVTQWMSTVTVSAGSSRNSSHVHDTGSSTSPSIRKLHSSSGVCGVGPAESTGKSVSRYCPGGSARRVDDRPPPAQEAARDRGHQLNRVAELDADHPQLLLERADDLDEHVLRGGVDLAEAIHALASALGHVGEALGQLAHDDVVLERAPCQRLELGAGRDRRALAVGRVADRDRPLGDDVRELAPGVDELVELQVKRPEQRPDDVPVELLADQGEVDQLDQRRLELVADVLALVRAEGGKMCALRG